MVSGARRDVLGDADFDMLYRQRWPTMLHLATLLTGSRSVAEDIVQDAFANTYRRWSRITDAAGATAYVRIAVVNGARSLYRRRRLRSSFDRNEGRVAVDTAVDAAPVAEHQVLRQAVAALPHRQREVLVLRYWLDLSEADIARTLGISRGTVKSTAARGLAALGRTVKEGP